ncbi:MAG: phage holin family protein [Bordetella sp.]|nr:phage holin family protein [Bordetella sp.]
MHSLVTVLTLVASVAICVRLLTYHRPDDARHRRCASWCAWLLIASTGGQALHILLAGAAAQVNAWHLGTLLVLLFLTFRARGNVAHLMRFH